MKVRFVEHAKERITERGTSEEEVNTVLFSGTDIPAKKGRKARENIFRYGEEWLGKIYQQKKVVVVYVEEGEEIVVITVKVLYGQWRQI
jgi:hypothetical protein